MAPVQLQPYRGSRAGGRATGSGFLNPGVEIGDEIAVIRGRGHGLVMAIPKDHHEDVFHKIIVTDMAPRRDRTTAPARRQPDDRLSSVMDNVNKAGTIPTNVLSIRLTLWVASAI